MKRMMSISLSIFLIVWAVLLFAGDSKANAGDISLYAGYWVGSSSAIFNDDAYTDAQYSIESLFVNTEGMGSVNMWTVTDKAKTEWTPSDVTETEKDYPIYPSNFKVSADGSYFVMSSTEIDPITGATVTYSGRCYGLSQAAGKFMEMRCITILSVKGGTWELDEKIVKNINYKRK